MSLCAILQKIAEIGTAPSIATELGHWAIYRPQTLFGREN